MSIKSLKKIFVLGRQENIHVQTNNKQTPTYNQEIQCTQQNEKCSPKFIYSKSNQQQSLEQYNGVNQILQWKGITQNQQKIVYYLPANLRIQINRVNRIDYMGCSAQLDISIYLWVMMKDFPKTIQDQIIDAGQLRINGTRTIHLKDIIMRKNNTESSENTSKKVVFFFTREILTMQISTDNFFSPFQLVNIQGSLQLRQIQLTQFSNQKRVVQVGFNFMQTDPFLHFRFKQLKNLGNYELAEGRVALKFSNEQQFGKMKFCVDKSGQLIEQIILPSFLRKQSETQQQQLARKIRDDDPPNAFKNATIVITLYKYPMTTLITVFVPFYLLSLLCIGVFFTANIMSLRSLSIFLLLMSYMSIIPAIRSTIPPTPSLIMVEVLVYLQSLCIIAIFIQSVLIRNIEDYVFDWASDPYFLFVIVFTLINFVFVLGLCFSHKCLWEPSYNRLTASTKQKIDKKFNTDEWYNDLCQIQFSSYLKYGKISLVFPIFREPFLNVLALGKRNVQKKIKILGKGKRL